MGVGRFGGIRVLVAQEAARLMYLEGVKQYFTAKRLAARRVLGRSGGVKAVRFRPSELPSNGEIREALLAIAEAAEGSDRSKRLFAMRVYALQCLQALEPFAPRLIGSVASGHVRRGSDVDLHVFAEDPSDVTAHVKQLGWRYELERVEVLKHGVINSYTHVHVDGIFPVELTVYEPQELRHRPRSSTDGKPIVRWSARRLESLLAQEHPDAWEKYLRTGEVPVLAEDDEEEAPGEWDSLLAGGEELLDDEEEALLGAVPDGWEPEDEDEKYDPLPGFESV